MTQLLQPGIATLLTQHEIYSLPNSLVHVTATNVLELGNSTTNATSATQFQPNTSTTTGTFVSAGFARCTGATTCIVMVKKF